MIELDFSKIRNHDGSQDNGFEELVCQLAHLSPPEGADYFIRKDGSGGDAGVECYWTLSDGSENAWQAKYFLNSLETGQWGQITKSVKTALEKHPKLTKYYVCLPRDWNNSRKTGRGGKQVVSSLDKWQEHVVKWEKLAEICGMKVEFCFWCKHEISLMLQRDVAEFSGRARYWFESPVLTKSVFERLAEKSKTALGERYTPEYHLDLPIAKTFNALGGTVKWWEDVNDKIKLWIKNTLKVEDAILRALEDLGEECDIRKNIDDIASLLKSGIKEGNFVQKIDLYVSEFELLEPKILDIVNALLYVKESKNENVFDSIRREFYGFESASRDLSYFFKNEVSKAAQKQSVLLIGEAGIGKSHLLCDVSLSRIAENLPTVFLLGQHYAGGNPLHALKEMLGLSNIENEEFLGALDAVGEAHNAKTLIVIDAINEGNYREDWQNYLSALLTDISRFEHISIVISCRTTYVDWLAADEYVGDLTVKVTHKGFKGYEHRAAEKYLSQQGIVKPSSPVTIPEFTNPLFLKTCCKAMREQGMTSFPKGLHGISSLFDFYVDSMEKTVAGIKAYRIGENVVRKALEALASALYPDNQFGLPVDEAVSLINGFDSRPNNGETLFDVLLHEGVISEDSIYDSGFKKKDHLVIRFTYERFSDHFIAQSLAEEIKGTELEKIFFSGGPLSHMFSTDSYHGYAGILSALSIIVAEKFKRELVDLLPKRILSRDWLFDQIFVDTLQWRAASSFSGRTLEILNSIPHQDYYSPSMDVILSLCTEPDHPWNAELLHRNLSRRKMPDRDVFWSTHITITDSHEGENEQESVLRSLIDWACFGDLEKVEDERIRLCAIALIWMTSSSNRKVRDQATKSTVRILTFYPELLITLLEKFCDVDDLYVLERLYAIAYGVIININNNKLILEISDWVWKKIFADGKPIPHILLRDYARGIMEYALYKDTLNEEVIPASFRPPYASEWPLHDPSEKEITDLIGDEFSSSIKSSIMGFPGDFGNYTMGRIHDWSPTEIDSDRPQTAYELQLLFSEVLKGELKDRFIKHINYQKEQDDREVNLKQLLEVSLQKREAKSKPTKYELLKKEIEESLDSKDKEHFRWVMGLGRADSVSSFSRKKAQRWVCKRAFDLGWTKDLFEDFERHHTGSHGRSESIIERIGKKYQWIAFYEFLAHVADNCLYIDKGYSDEDHSKYFGPWRLHKRNIDPTHWMRKTGDDGWGEWEKEYWWQPYVYPLYGTSIDEMQNWLWDESIVPPFENLLEVKDENSNKWIVLKSFSSWKTESEEEKDEMPYKGAWYRINSCIVKNSDLEILKEALCGDGFCDPEVLRSETTEHQGFIGEYPWHPIYKDMKAWSSDMGYSITAKIDNLIPSAVYEWEHGSSDGSLEKTISIYLPSKELIEKLNLNSSQKSFGQWVDDRDEVVFCDPSADCDGPSSALIKKEIFYEWLKNNDLNLVWLVGGEKQLFTHWSHKFYGKLNYSGLYVLGEDGVFGDLWFDKEEPEGDK